MKKLALLLFLLLIFSCSQPETIEKTVEKTTVQCFDGSEADSIDNCPEAEDVEDNEEHEETEEEYDEIEDLGDFKLVYATSQHSRFKELEELFKEDKIFDETIETLNEDFILPVDVYVRFMECGEVNAMYIPSQKQIVMCYEFIEYTSDLVEPFVETEEEWDQTILDITYFVFFHELGHAFVDVFELPITGKEEDAVDQLATYILVEDNPEAQIMALNSAAFFALTGLSSGMDGLVFWDEHSLDLQRFYNIACWTYGSDPESLEEEVLEVIPESRAVRCEDEYNQLADTWYWLLEPYSVYAQENNE